jgi:hypothetical protein
MKIESLITQLEKEWELSSGFLGNLRTGTFDPDGLARLIEILQSVNLEDATTLERRFVSLTWYIPLFMDWQRQRLREKGTDTSGLDSGINQIQSLLESILGVP